MSLLPRNRPSILPRVERKLRRKHNFKLLDRLEEVSDAPAGLALKIAEALTLDLADTLSATLVTRLKASIDVIFDVRKVLNNAFGHVLDHDSLPAGFTVAKAKGLYDRLQLELVSIESLLTRPGSVAKQLTDELDPKLLDEALRDAIGLTESGRLGGIRKTLHDLASYSQYWSNLQTRGGGHPPFEEVVLPDGSKILVNTVDKELVIVQRPDGLLEARRRADGTPKNAPELGEVIAVEWAILDRYKDEGQITTRGVFNANHAPEKGLMKELFGHWFDYREVPCLWVRDTFRYSTHGRISALQKNVNKYRKQKLNYAELRRGAVMEHIGAGVPSAVAEAFMLRVDMYVAREVFPRMFFELLPDLAEVAKLLGMMNPIRLKKMLADSGVQLTDLQLKTLLDLVSRKATP